MATKSASAACDGQHCNLLCISNPGEEPVFVCTLHGTSNIEDMNPHTTELEQPLVPYALFTPQLGDYIIFFGEPKTGKSITANYLARASGLDPAQVDICDKNGMWPSRDAVRNMEKLTIHVSEKIPPLHAIKMATHVYIHKLEDKYWTALFRAFTMNVTGWTWFCIGGGTSTRNVRLDRKDVSFDVVFSLY